MVPMKRWVVALAALLVGGSVSAALLFFANPARDAADVYVAARDVPAGASLGPDVIALERVSLTSGRSLLFGRGDETALVGRRASHDLASGQLIQRGDVVDASSFVDRRLVFLPIKD